MCCSPLLGALAALHQPVAARRPAMVITGGDEPPNVAAAAVDPEAKDDEDKHSHRSDDTVWESAEGKDEDDLIENTVGQSKQDTLFIKLEHFVSKQFGKKGSEKRPSVTLETMEQHRSEEDFWCIIDGKVFDLGPFLRGEAKHPGGKSILTRQLGLGGQNADERFVRWHHPSGNTVRRAPDYFIGDLGGYVPKEKAKNCCSIS
mmetsp:Transcript_31350/g.80598  ORF Transcript_31350/g.80598 Transcript_31350/m.80598 type:complete len:203 (-) Transcript_31350:90-698(-)